jgi:serine protease Do
MDRFRSRTDNRPRKGGQSPFSPDHLAMVPAAQKGTVPAAADVPPGGSRIGSTHRNLLALALAIALTGPLAVSVGAAEPSAVSADHIRQWIGQLSSDDYGTRAEATVQLTRAGKSVVDAVTAAALQDDLEVAHRAVEVLQTLLASEDVATGDAAADSLAKIAEARAGSSADLAADALSDFQGLRQERTLEELKRLGAMVIVGNQNTGNADGIQIVIGSEWRGTAADLKLLKRVPDLEMLKIYGVGFVDDDLKHLEGLNRLSEIDLFGSKVTADGAARLAQLYPGVKIDRRSNAMLGVSGLTDPAGCRINFVQPNSAADRAGLQEQDIILRFQDQQIPDFETLTSQIGSRNPGDKVTIELRRRDEANNRDEVLTKEVELGSWK